MNDEFDAMEEEKSEENGSASGLELMEVYKRCFLSDAKHLIPVAIASALWLATVWIPFVNIGTTIAMFTLPIWIVEGRKLSPIDLFLGEHRAKMFGFFRLQGLVLAACFVFLLVMMSAVSRMVLMDAMASMPGVPRDFGIGFWSWVKTLLLFACAAVPLFMMTTAWSMAPFLLIDKGLEPSEALRTSFKITEGLRLRIFGIYAIPLVAGCVLLRFLGDIRFVGWIFSAVIVVAVSTAVVSLTAKLYGTLKNRAD